jgi:hypothetical protein
MRGDLEKGGLGAPGRGQTQTTMARQIGIPITATGTTISTELILSIASASFGKPGLEHLPDLGPCPRPDRAKSRLEPSLASFTPQARR